MRNEKGEVQEVMCPPVSFGPNERNASFSARFRIALPGVAAALFASAIAGNARAAPLDGNATETRPPHKRVADPAADTKPADAEHNNGVLGPVRLGAFAGVGFPRPLSIEGMIKFDDLVGIGVEYGALPSMTISGVNAQLNAIAVDARIFPMRNGFFIGLAIGHQHLDINSTVSLPEGAGSYTGDVTADTWYVNPRIGFLWTVRWGLTVGIDAGIQIPVSASLTNNVPSELSEGQTAQNVATTFGKDALPTVNLLRLGMLF